MSGNREGAAEQEWKPRFLKPLHDVDIEPMPRAGAFLRRNGARRVAVGAMTGKTRRQSACGLCLRGHRPERRLSVLSERELVERAALRLMEVRRATLERLVNLLIHNRFLTRDGVIAEVDRLRLEAQHQAVARVGTVGAHEAIRRHDAVVQSLGHLLFYLRFERCPNVMTGEERRLCERLGAEIAEREKLRSSRGSLDQVAI